MSFPTKTQQTQQDPQAQTSVDTLMPSDHIYTRADSRSTIFRDSDFFEDEQTNTPRADYNDFILFPDDHHNTAHTDQFFADADFSVTGHQGSIYDGKENGAHQVGTKLSHTNKLATSPRPQFYDAVRDAVEQLVNEAGTAALSADYNNQSANSQSPPPTPYLRPVELWGCTVHRHESIAYRFEQSPQQVIEARLREKQ